MRSEWPSRTKGISKFHQVRDINNKSSYVYDCDGKNLLVFRVEGCKVIEEEGVDQEDDHKLWVQQRYSSKEAVRTQADD